MHGCAALRTLPSSRITAASASEVKDPPQVALLRDAIRQQCKVAINYEDAQGSLSDRYLDDVRVLAAWCEHRSAYRHFHFDRLHLRTISEERYPGRRQSIVRRWRQQDRDWRSILTVSDTPIRYQLTGALASRTLFKGKIDDFLPIEPDGGAPAQ
jgi:predicted DNA-binding transcriptional regulator YafY